jgi:hypothetical protein
MTPFISITSEGGNVGRFRWINKRPVERMGRRGTGWGFFWFGEPQWKDESPQHIYCRCACVPLLAHTSSSATSMTMAS